MNFCNVCRYYQANKDKGGAAAELKRGIAKGAAAPWHRRMPSGRRERLNITGKRNRTARGSAKLPSANRANDLPPVARHASPVANRCHSAEGNAKLKMQSATLGAENAKLKMKNAKLGAGKAT